MASKIIMPKQGLQMTEGMITAWLKQEGDAVALDEPLFEMETDKLAITIGSTAEGTLLKILHPADDVVPITETIAIIGEAGEDISALLAEDTSAGEAECPQAAAEPAPVPVAGTPAAASPERQFISPRAKRIAGEKGLDYSGLTGSGPDGMIVERDLEQIGRIQASPLAKKLADLHQVDLSQISGSGPRGKILAGDVRVAEAPAPAEIPMEPAATPVGGERKVRLSGMRKVVAKRMYESLHTMAQANHRISVDMTEAVRLREQYKKNEIKVSYNDIILRCTARALADCPFMNVSFEEDGIVFKDYINLGVAVALEDGLIVPVIRNADRMTLEQLSMASRELADKARKNQLQMEEYSGGTFTVTNLGMMDIDDFTPVINPPEAGILGVGKLEKRVVVTDDEQMEIRPYLRLSLTYDHRAIDGAPAAKFLQRVKKLLENPGLLL